MDYAEEQRNELEALQSIYFAEFRLVESSDADPSSISFAIHIQSNPDEIPDSLQEDQCSVDILVKFPPEYPEHVPDLELKEAQGLDEDTVQEWEEELRQLALESLGMAMIFTLTGRLKENVDEKVHARVQARNAQAEEKLRREEELEKQKVEGTPVTVETFLAWKAKFDKEQAEKFKEERMHEEKLKKPTGRQLFESDKTLVASDAKYTEEGEVDVDITLFADMSLEDLDDMEDAETVANMIRSAADE